MNPTTFIFFIALTCSFIASIKGRNYIMWFILGLTTSFVGIFLILIFPSKPKLLEKASDNNMESVDDIDQEVQVNYNSRIN